MSERYHIIYKRDRKKFINDFNRYIEHNKDGYLLILSPEDTYEDGRIGNKYIDDMAVTLADTLDENPSAVLATPKRLFQFPNRISGVMFNVGLISRLPYRLNDELTYNYEADYLFKLIEDHPFMIQQDVIYTQGEPGDGNYREFSGIYDINWYINDLDIFLIPFLKKHYENKEENPLSFFAQYYAMYNITCRLDANQNNNNRHVLDSQQTDLFRRKIAEALQYVDDDIIMNVHDYPLVKRDYQYGRMLLRLKHAYGTGEYVSDYAFDDFIDIREETSEETSEETPSHMQLMLYTGDVLIYNSDRLSCNIQFMDYKDGKLEIDGSVPDIYDKSKVRYFFEMDGKEYDVDFCDRYSLTKYFGEPAYKRYPFHASIDLGDAIKDSKESVVRFYIGYNGNKYPVKFEFKSHTSRLAAYPRSTYWHFNKYIMTAEHTLDETEADIVTGLVIRRYNWFRMAAKECHVDWELLTSFSMHRFHFFLLRLAWVITHPYYGRKNIWMFFDKIYKGGDSSEYLYKYSAKRIKDKAYKKDENRAFYPDKLYYLVDKNASDYRRLKEEGYKPLKRGSFRHRLIFLNADMMIVSNSTVFAFNDYYLENSRYIRGIVDFHTVCVQHGLSVQKIALAQQRLRDNTRLYFCASKYEIDNLSHPVYDYVGYDALKLTGVPRYDGLINNDKKQIMISPTWRMQSAMLVSKNEGVERDYNPLFKETAYYKVYNSLINDPKLIEAAERYGYRIAYVLHPIVSPQADDFDKNDYVDIIPAVGDMSYEKMFCESSLMVTDYSGIQFDFAYMRKPLVYYHPEELEAHYEEGTYHYDTMAFGEIVHKKTELVNLLIEYMESGCEMKEIYRMRADDFYEYNDHDNCCRIFEEIIKYQSRL